MPSPGVMVTAFIDGADLGRGGRARRTPARRAAAAPLPHRMPRQVSGAGFLFWPFHVIRDYARTLRAASRTREGVPGFLALAERAGGAQVPLPIVFGHHDLLPANFLDDGDRLWLIDFEYAGFGTAMFDLAGAASNAGMPPEARTRCCRLFRATRRPALRRAFDAMQAPRCCARRCGPWSRTCTCRARRRLRAYARREPRAARPRRARPPTAAHGEQT
jgi:hypothetical protein